MIAFLLAFAIQLTFQPKPVDAFFTDNRTFRCQLGDGEGRAYIDQKIENRRGDKFTDEIIFDNVNYEKSTVRIIGSGGGDDAVVFDGPLAVSFLEQTVYGGLVMTTIDKRSVGVGLYRASMSRHLPNTLGGFTATQFYGVCRGQL